MSVFDYMYMAGDKANHFAWGVISSALVTTIIAVLYLFGIFFTYWWLPAVAVVTPLVIGWGKEKYDARHDAFHTYDPKDALFTAMGGLPLAFFLVVTQLVNMYARG